MPKRKRKAPQPYHYNLAKTLVRARAERALADDEELERQAARWVEQADYATIGERQVKSGKETPGRRGKHKVPPETLRDEVKAFHARLPRLTFNDACHRVAKKFGYRSAWSVKKAAAAIKWSHPR